MAEAKTSNREDMTPEEAETRAQRRARLAQILSRGFVNTRLDVKLSGGKVAQWVRETDEDVQRYESLGYEVETEEGEGLHDTGDNRRRVGDVILMSTSQENYDDISEVRAELRTRRAEAGKKLYTDKAEQVPDIPVLDESVRHQ